MKTSTKLAKIDKFLEKHRFAKVKGQKDKILIFLGFHKVDTTEIDSELYIKQDRLDWRGKKVKIFAPLESHITKIPERNKISIDYDPITYAVVFYFWLNDKELYYFITSREALEDDLIKKETILEFIKSLNDHSDTPASNRSDNKI